jgi:hypothetical protein
MPKHFPSSSLFFAILSGLVSAAPGRALAEGEPAAPSAPPHAPEGVSGGDGSSVAQSWHVELAATVGYTSPPIRGGTTPFGTGFGARIGAAFDHLYLGISGVSYLGGTDVAITETALAGGFDIGYGTFVDWGGVRFILRPLVGVGGVRVSHTDPSTAKTADVVTSASGRSGGGSSDTTTVDSVYVQPALALLAASGSFVGGLGANMLVLPNISYGGGAATTWISYGVSGQIGLRF